METNCLGHCRVEMLRNIETEKLNITTGDLDLGYGKDGTYRMHKRSFLAFRFILEPRPVLESA